MIFLKMGFKLNFDEIFFISSEMNDNKVSDKLYKIVFKIWFKSNFDEFFFISSEMIDNKGLWYTE